MEELLAHVVVKAFTHLEAFVTLLIELFLEKFSKALRGRNFNEDFEFSKKMAKRLSLHFI